MFPPVELLRSLAGPPDAAPPALLTRLFSVPFSPLIKFAFGGKLLKIVPPPGRGRPCGGQG